MGFRVRHIPSVRLAEVVFSGLVTAEQIIAALQAVYHPGYWEPTWRALWRGEALLGVDLDPEGLEDVTDWKLVYRAERQAGVSVVVGDVPLVRELGLLISRYREPGRRIHLADTLDDALKHLDLQGLEHPDAVTTALMP